MHKYKNTEAQCLVETTVLKSTRWRVLFCDFCWQNCGGSGCNPSGGKSTIVHLHKIPTLILKLAGNWQSFPLMLLCLYLSITVFLVCYAHSFTLARNNRSYYICQFCECFPMTVLTHTHTQQVKITDILGPLTSLWNQLYTQVFTLDCGNGHPTCHGIHTLLDSPVIIQGLPMDSWPARAWSQSLSVKLSNSSRIPQRNPQLLMPDFWQSVWPWKRGINV